MTSSRRDFLLLAGAAASRLARSQYVLPPQSPPKETFPPTSAQAAEIARKLASLGGRLSALAKGNTPAGLLAEVEIFHKAAAWIGRFNEWYGKDAAAQTIALLDIGLERAAELEGGKSSWTSATGPVIRAYRSRIDGSVQPYLAYVPASYRAGTPARLDVILHGTNRGMVEVQFLSHHQIVAGSVPVPPVDFLQIEVLGRTNNAYRWAGETDVFEAVEAARKSYTVDPNRIILRGFSMGGSGTWHLGLQHPDQWAAIEPGAGFNDTIRYGRMPNLPAYQRKTLHIYDSRDYALNSFELPTAAYTGEDDPQIQNLENVRNELAKSDVHFEQQGLNWVTRDIPMIMLVGPHTGHRWEPESRKRANVFIDAAAERGRVEPDRIRFVTYTTRYHRCFWVRVDGLERHYDRAEVDATRDKGAASLEVKTVNVSVLTLNAAGVKKIVLDGAVFSAAGGTFSKIGGSWREGDPRAAAKRPGLQGPIDDAFFDSFLCVRPTGETANDLAGRYAQETLNHFSADFAKFFRGDIRVKDDSAVTPQDIADHHLVLFGDTQSNQLLRRMMGRLPLRWDAQQLAFNGKTYDAANHVIVLIQPNPLNPGRYVVLNSGHSFHANEMAATNASLFPRFGDYAVLRLRQPVSAEVESEVVTAGYFGEDWKLA